MKTIAILDDDPTLVELYNNILQEEGYNPVPLALSRDLKILLEDIEQSQAKVLILDIRIPGIDTYKVIEELEARPAHRRAKILVCSAAYQELANLSQKLGEAGISVPMILQKPFDLEVFVEQIEKLVEDD